MSDDPAKSPRLTPQKAKFCRLFVELGNATAAARAAGYSAPNVKGSKLLAKDKETGEYKDASIAAELIRLRSPGRSVEVVQAVPTTRVTTLDEMERTLKQNLLELALNETTSDGPRVQATVALLKAIGADVPRESGDKNTEDARKAIAQLLGIKS